MPKRTPRVTFELLKNDKNGVRTWHVEAIHVTITGNKRKYTEDELKLGARSLSFRPININHDEELWLPHNPFNPTDESDNRTLALTFVPKDRGVSGKIQVADPDVNEMIERGEINRLSIEQIPVEGEDCACNMLEGCFCEQNGVTFTGIALLTADTRPGDPETKITPESISDIREKLEKLKAKFKELRPKVIEAEETAVEPKKEGGCGCKGKKEDQHPGDCPPGHHKMPDGSCMPDGADNNMSAAEAAINDYIRQKKEQGVSDCIAHFIRTGKPQDQAVAICMNNPNAHNEAKEQQQEARVARQFLEALIKHSRSLEAQ